MPRGGNRKGAGRKSNAEMGLDPPARISVSTGVELFNDLVDMSRDRGLSVSELARDQLERAAARWKRKGGKP